VEGHLEAAYQEEDHLVEAYLAEGHLVEAFPEVVRQPSDPSGPDSALLPEPGVQLQFPVEPVPV
tara:strand:+ start:201 stop:392 length:192 start_codon:yes stop_codon:yes gene_type:complete